MSAYGRPDFLSEKRIDEGQLPGWGDDALFQAMHDAGHKGVLIQERPDVVAAAMFDPDAINMGAGALAAKPAGALGANALRTSPKLKAYHGSPHDFDRFDLSKIGTGEGAQAYGHGLYFAEKEAVARSYRDSLTDMFTMKSDRALKQAGGDM